MTTPGTTKVFGVLVPLMIALSACGTSAASTEVELSSAAAEGRSLANAKGCASCHGTSGQGGVGPAFQGLFESSVELNDGTTVTADREYLYESIKDPPATRVAGYRLPMPTIRLSDEEIDQIITYIEALSAPPEGETP